MNSSIKTAQLQNKTAQFHRLYGELVALLNEQLNCLKNSDSQNSNSSPNKAADILSRLEC